MCLERSSSDTRINAGGFLAERGKISLVNEQQFGVGVFGTLPGKQVKKTLDGGVTTLMTHVDENRDCTRCA